jgi:hypothetical protein
MLKIVVPILVLISAQAAMDSAQARGTITHPVAHLEVLPPVGWSVSYCTISGPAFAYSWATPTNSETCNFSYLNYSGTYTVTVYEEAPLRGAVTSEAIVIEPLSPGQAMPTVVIQMEAA